MNGILKSILANKHTSGSAFLIIASSAIESLGPIWFPHFAEQFKGTSHWIEKAAFAYGLAMAGDASKAKADLEEVKGSVVSAIQTGNTQFIKQTDK